VVTLIDFLIVGTSRSGTTLAQRLAAELPGVAIPPETHFLTKFLPRLQKFGPIATAQTDALERVTARLGFGRPIDVSQLDRSSPLALFDSLVHQLAGDGSVYGEKTPAHLRWWRPLMRTLPDLKLVGIVRHPCAVALSQRGVPWGTKSIEQFASRWNFDQRLLLKAFKEQPHRVLIVRYEDMVNDPTAIQKRIAEHIGIGLAPKLQHVDGHAIGLEREWWKSEATQAISTEHIDSWRSELDRRSQAVIASACRREMRKFSYVAPRGPVTSPASRYRLAQTTLRLTAEQRKIDRQRMV